MATGRTGVWEIVNALTPLRCLAFCLAARQGAQNGGRCFGLAR
jgi:hypothetical protein